MTMHHGPESVAALHAKEQKTPFKFTTKEYRLLIVGLLIGLAAFLMGYIMSPARAWISYLVDNFYFVSLALGAAFWLAISLITNGSFLSPFRKIAEAVLSFLPVSFVLSLGVLFGLSTLYEWSHEHVVHNDALLQGKAPYLNPTGFAIRLVIVFAIWLGLTALMRGVFKKQRKVTEDTSLSAGERVQKLLKLSERGTMWGAFFLATFAYSFSVFSWDWLMSIRPHWYSTIYGLYTFSGVMVGGLAVIILGAIWLQERGHLNLVLTKDHYHDLGKLLFGFSTFWAYIWISQYLLIWYSNIPEETGYFLLRQGKGWDWLLFLNLALNWGIPFLVLMPRAAKRSTYILKRICIVIVIGRWLDLFLLAAPDIYAHAHQDEIQIGWVELGVGLGFASLFILIVGHYLSKNSLIAHEDPYLPEGLALHQ